RLSNLLDDEPGEIAVVVADIDGFGVINDSFGHDAGDHVLRHVADRLRSIEPSPHTVARLAGDEFVLLFRGIDHPSSAQAAGESTRAALDAPLSGLAGSVRVTVGLCAGVTIAGHRTEAPEALRNAQTALHRAKSSGPGNVRLFDQAMRDAAAGRLGLEQELREAIEQQHLSLDYQIGVDAQTGVMVGAEALVRWEHPSGRRMPDEFISLAEETGLIVPLGRAVMRTAVRQAAAWRGSGDLPDRFRVSINVSARQVDDPDRLLYDLVQDLGVHPSAAGGIAIELTETVVAENPRVPYLLDECRALGVAVLLDDFGTGYSSFAALRNYPVDYIKIDRSFVNHVANGGRDTAMVRAMIEMANALGIGVIAEGVETIAQRDALVTLGCDVIQGHLIHRPSSPPAVTALLRGGHVLD
ncbi:MAG: bifunctional diguanylate cyclase/phosphodiesterase, partial [Acidimicrobiales bacterium]|nr:bifunctional diguanylate cyclase/phosphodiesterase [Acidimicrobiales bacterium]